ncbi:MAG TPA: ABC transporter permease [Terracidiphilus sp.]|nr:ABC transporter permease [Terracidiphilus sp.]
MLDLVRRGWNRVRALLHREGMDRDLDAEIAAHLEMATEEKLQQGMDREEARRLALAEFGGVQQARERQREARGLPFLDVLRQDLRYTLRSLRHDAGFATVAVFILALGIGANVAVFSVVNTLLLRPLPFPSAHELVWIAPPPTKCGLSCATYSTDAYDEFRAYSRSYQDVTGYFAFSGPDNLSLSAGGAQIAATSIDVIANFFQVLGVRPAMGRLFTADDARNGAAPVVLLSNAWWRTQFNADPDIVGKTFDMNGQQTTVIGVLPRSFDFGAMFAPGTKVDAITPLNLYGPPRDWGNIVTMIGRLKPGISMEQARQDATAAAPHMCGNNKYPKSCGSYAEDGVIPVTLKQHVSGRLRRALVVLWSAVGLILLIACVNLANLLLARSASRTKEFAMRGALGASRGRIVRQLLTESLVLSFAGALLGLGLAFLLVSWLAHQGSIALPLLSTLHIDGSSLSWTLLIAVVTAVLFGFSPGLRMASGNLYESLKDSGQGSGQSRKHERVRSVLVVSEVAIACMLLVGAGLLLRSFVKVLDVDLGFQPEHAAAIKVDFDDSAPTNDASIQKRTEGYQQILAKVDAIPGVEAAGITDYLPLGQNRSWDTPLPVGITPPEKVPAGPLVYVISPGYMRAMGMRLRGRDFTWDDGPHSEPVAIINKSYAHYLASLAHWSDGDALGHLLTGGPPPQAMRIVGVADNVHEESTESDAGWQIYYPTTQAGPAGTLLVVRSQLRPATLANSVLRTLRELNPQQTAAEFKPLQMLVDHANSPRRFFMLLVASFAALGLLLAALGIYGIISYSVTRQAQEIGIRMALGASMGRVLRLVLGGTLRLVCAGIVLGAMASFALARLIASLLFATSPWDVATYLGMALGLLIVALLAGYLPARRASRIDPMIVLRSN